MIPTGIKIVDNILHGGLKSGIFDIFGSSGVGKTQLALQITKNCISKGKEVLFYDIKGEFRPERLHELLTSNSLDPQLLQKVKISRITNTQEQTSHLDSIDVTEYSLVVIDDITDLFSFEYSNKKKAIEKNTSLMRYLKRLSQISVDNNIPIVITNTVVNIDSKEKESLGDVINLFSHVKLHLSKGNSSYHGKIQIPGTNTLFSYVLSKEGFCQLNSYE